MTDVLTFIVGDEKFGFSISVDNDAPIKRSYSTAGRSVDECVRKAFLSAIPLYNVMVAGSDGRDLMTVFPSVQSLKSFQKYDNPYWDGVFDALRPLNISINPIYRASRLQKKTADKDLKKSVRVEPTFSMADLVASTEE